MMARRILAFLLMILDAGIFIGICLLLRYAMEASRFFTPDAQQWAMDRYLFFGIAGACVYVLLGWGAQLYTIRSPLSAARVPIRTAANCFIIFLLILYTSWRYNAYFDAGQLISHRTVLYSLMGIYVITTLMHIGSASLLSSSRKQYP